MRAEHRGAPGRFSLVSLAALLTGIMLWVAASTILKVAEPWDSPGYWPAYLLALVLAGAFG